MTNKSTIIAVIVGFLLVVLCGCNAVENLTNSSTRLLIDAITGNDLTGSEGATTVFSDVITDGAIVNDNAQATLRAELIDPLATDSTYYQQVVVDQIDIEYSRADGLSVQGRDVPYSFSQKVHVLVEVGDSPVDLGFVLVQHNAKEESPLIELMSFGQEKVLKMEAKVTFYAKDLGGNRLAPVSGSISVWFANFGD